LYACSSINMLALLSADVLAPPNFVHSKHRTYNKQLSSFEELHQFVLYFSTQFNALYGRSPAPIGQTRLLLMLYPVYIR
jgi:hypothetical protein